MSLIASATTWQTFTASEAEQIFIESGVVRLYDGADIPSDGNPEAHGAPYPAGESVVMGPGTVHYIDAEPLSSTLARLSRPNT